MTCLLLSSGPEITPLDCQPRSGMQKLHGNAVLWLDLQIRSDRSTSPEPPISECHLKKVVLVALTALFSTESWLHPIESWLVMKRWWNVGHVRLHFPVTLIQQVCRENEKCSKSWLRIKFPQPSRSTAGVSAVRKTLEKAGDAKFLLMFYFRPRVYWTWRLKTMRVVLFQSWLRKPEQNYLMTAWKWKFRGIDLKIHFRDRGMHLRNSVRRERDFSGAAGLLRRRSALVVTAADSKCRRRRKMKTKHRKFTATSIQLSEASWRSTEQLSFFSPPFLLQISRYRSVSSLASVNKRFRNTSERLSQLRSVSVGGVRGEVFFLPPVLELFLSSADLKILIKTPEKHTRAVAPSRRSLMAGN